MFSTRRTLAVTALCAVTLLTGCSGDDDGDDSANPGDSASGSPSASQSLPGAPCEATVEVTGKVEASWTGVANVVTSGGQATYTAADGEANLVVGSGTKKQPSAPIFALSGDVFYGKPGAKGVEADPKGGGAEVDTDVTGKVGGKGKPVTLHVVASFDC
jgi:hypothetical protein